MHAYLNLMELLVGGPSRLRYVPRWSTCRVGSRENVAEHSFYTALYSMILAQWCEVQHPRMKINHGELLQRALMHDYEEARTGDINRPFKHSSEELRALIDSMAGQAFEDVWRNTVGQGPRLERLKSLWKDAKDESIEGRILNFADYLSVLAYTINEVRSANWTIREHCSGMRAYQDKFKAPEYEFVAELVEKAEHALNVYVLGPITSAAQLEDQTWRG